MQKWDSALNSSLLCAPGSKGLFLLGLSIQDIRESEDTLFGSPFWIFFIFTREQIREDERVLLFTDAEMLQFFNRVSFVPCKKHHAFFVPTVLLKKDTPHKHTHSLS